MKAYHIDPRNFFKTQEDEKKENHIWTYYSQIAENQNRKKKKKMNAGGGENRYITQRGKIIWKMTDFSAKQWREENGIKTFRFYTKTCKFRILHVAIYLKSEGKTKTF